MSPRAAPMTPQERRDHLITVTLPLLHEQGRGVSTRQIAESAGVAEGTIFRVFASKDELIEAAVARVLDPEAFLAKVSGVDAQLPLREMLLELATLLTARYAEVFELAAAIGTVGPPGTHEAMRQGRQRVDRALVQALTPHAELLRISPELMVQLLRSLVFAGTHPHLADGNPQSAELVVDTLLDGVRAGF